MSANRSRLMSLPPPVMGSVLDFRHLTDCEIAALDEECRAGFGPRPGELDDDRAAFLLSLAALAVCGLIAAGFALVAK